MSLDSDVIVDRRRIRRKLTFWRVAAALVAIAAIVTVGVVATPGGRSALTASGSIARVNIEGLIRSDNDRVEALERLEKSQAAAVIVHINSPGGTTAGSEQLYDALVRLKAKKPLVVVVEGLAASGGYITAIAADHIVAQQSSLVGSIGVLFQFPNFTELAENRRRQGRGSEVLAAESGAQRLRADQSGSARRARCAGEGFLRLVSRPGERAARHGRRAARKSRGRTRLHRPSGGRSQADRSARRRENRGRLAGRAEEASRAICRCAISSWRRASAT